MDRQRVLQGQTIVIGGDRIAQIGPSRAIKVPRNARQIEAKGKYIIPRLVDAHVHLESETEFPLLSRKRHNYVFHLDGRRAHLLWRKQVASGEILGRRSAAAAMIART